MNWYLPEGLQPRTAPLSAAQLRQALERGTLLTAPALWCDEAHGLHVDLGCCEGVIPRAEADLGVAEGTARDIAILSRVGRPVTFRVTALPAGEPAQLSRAAAQREARDAVFARRRPGDILPAVVTSLAPFGAFCDVGCGFPALLPLERLAVARVRHSRERLARDQPIYAAVLRLDESRRRVTLTLRELLGTWEENAARFRAGQTVPGVVRGVTGYGVFVELAPNLSGLAEADPSLQPGDAVTVYLKSIDPARRRIKLAILSRLDAAALPRPPLPYTRTEGHLDAWQYRADEPKRRVLF